MAAAVAAAVWVAAIVEWTNGSGSLRDIEDYLGPAVPTVSAEREQEYKVHLLNAATASTAVIHVHLRRLSVADQTVHAHVSVDIDDGTIGKIFDTNANRSLTVDDFSGQLYGPMWLTVQMGQVFVRLSAAALKSWAWQSMCSSLTTHGSGP